MKPALFTAGLILCLPHLLSAAEYKIRLHRPFAVGAEFRQSTASEQTFRSSAAAGSRSLKQDRKSAKAEFESTVKVLAVDAKGQITKAQHTVQKCTLAAGGEKRSLMPSATIVIAAAGKTDSEFLVDGLPPNPEQKQALSMTVFLNKTEHTADDMFGTDAPKKVGESWPISSDRFSIVFGEQALQGNKEPIRGESFLEGVVALGNIQCLEISSKVMLKNQPIPVPPSAKVKNALAVFRASGKFPIDTALGPLEENTEITTELIAEKKSEGNAPPITFQFSTGLKISTQYQYPARQTP